MKIYEYTQLHIPIITQKTIEIYNIPSIIHNGNFYLEILKVMYELTKSVQISKKYLTNISPSRKMNLTKITLDYGATSINKQLSPSQYIYLI